MPNRHRRELASPVEAALSRSAAGRRRGRHGEAGENRVDQLAQEALAQRGVTMEESVVQRPVDQVERKLDVGGGRELPPFDRLGECGPGRIAARLDEALPPLLSLLRPWVHLLGQRPYGRVRRALRGPGRCVRSCDAAAHSW
jgi:hypothetical protein